MSHTLTLWLAGQSITACSPLPHPLSPSTGVLCELAQHEPSFGCAASLQYSKQLRQLFLAWEHRDMRRFVCMKRGGLGVCVRVSVYICVRLCLCMRGEEGCFMVGEGEHKQASAFVSTHTRCFCHSCCPCGCCVYGYPSLSVSTACRAVGLLQQYITLTLYQQQMLTAGVQAATKLLGLIHEANQVRACVCRTNQALFVVTRCACQD